MHTNVYVSKIFKFVKDCQFGIGIANLEIPFLNLVLGYGRDKLKIIF